MFDTKVPKYSKIEVKLKPQENPFINGFKESAPSIVVHSFDDAGLVITGNFLIVVIDEKDNINNSLSSTGKIFELKEVLSYRTHQE